MRISRDLVTHHLEVGAPFVATVSCGERFDVETHDCRTGTITARSTTDDLRETRWINPVTGPIEIEGAMPGDVLAIDLHAVDVADRGLMIHRPGTSAIEGIDDPVFRIIEINDRIAIPPVTVPRRPMVGFIGLTPADHTAGTLLGGSYGGNMDTNLITTGSRVFLPVTIAGAGLHIGDLHAAMADGEVFLTGVEVAGEVSVSVHRLTPADLGGKELPTPLLETAESIITIATGDTLDLAARAALTAGMCILTEWVGLTRIDSGFFMSAACDLRVSQFLPGLSIHCRLEIPKEPLARAGLRSTILSEPLPSATGILK